MIVYYIIILNIYIYCILLYYIYIVSYKICVYIIYANGQYVFNLSGNCINCMFMQFLPGTSSMVAVFGGGVGGGGGSGGYVLHFSLAK